MMNMKRNALQKAYLDRWQSTSVGGEGPIDGVIMAISPWAAPRLGQTQNDMYVAYTSVWNFLGKFSLTPSHLFLLIFHRFPGMRFPRDIRR